MKLLFRSAITLMYSFYSTLREETLYEAVQLVESVDQDKRGGTMARKTIFVSDLTGSEIRDQKDAAVVTITYGDARRGTVRLDVLASEVDDLARKGQKIARRGRPRKESA